MHTDTWCRIHFQNNRLSFLIRNRDIRTDDIDSGNIQPNGLSGKHCQMGIRRMNLVSHIDSRSSCGQIGIADDPNDFAISWDFIQAAFPLGQAAFSEFHRDFAHWLLVIFSAKRVLVLGFNQLADGQHPVPGDAGWQAKTGSNQLSIHDKHPVIFPGIITFDNKLCVPAVLLGYIIIGSFQMFEVLQVGDNAFPLSSVYGLNHNRINDLFTGHPKLFTLLNHDPARDGKSRTFQQTLRHFLITSILHS
ncbi:hypothetical protein D3C86_1235610 [compost metagenome]